MIGFNYLGKMGQLGNQMFQYASLRGIAKNRGFNFCIPFHNEVVVDSLGNKLKIELFNPFVMSNVTQLNIQLIDQDRPNVEESTFAFDEKLFNECPDWVNLQGYFQTEKYFKNIEDEIRQDFTFKNEIALLCKHRMSEVDRPVALHIRRTDYQQYSHHPIQPLSYYEEALSKFDDDREVIIFSDDPVWCHQQKLFDSDRFMISENDHLLDLCMMTLCSDFIIANSSFSWWGAWLSESKDKTVVAPKNWFGSPLSEQNDTKDLYCPGWVVI